MDKTSFKDNRLHFINQVDEIIKVHHWRFAGLFLGRAPQIYPLNLIEEYENLLE